MRIVDVDGEKMEALFTIVLERFRRFYIKKGSTVLARGKRGDLCEIGHRRKGKEHWQVLELARIYHCEGCVCLSSIIRIEFDYPTKRYVVKFKGKQVAKGFANGIAGPGENEKFPDLKYYALVK